jgi:cell division GTPase FtsZ
MGKVKVNMVIRFLKGMQVEKVNVLGEDEAKDDNELIQKVIEDIDMFYQVELE